MIPSNAHAPVDFPMIQTEEEVKDMMYDYVILSNLTNLQKTLIVAIVKDIMSEKQRTYDELAADLGIHRNTVATNMANPRFGTALGLMMVAVVRGESHLYVRKMQELALNGDFRALKFMLEYGRTYTPRSSVTTRSLNMNLDANRFSPPETFDEAFDQFLTMCGERGISAERIAERYRELRTQQAW